MEARPDTHDSSIPLVGVLTIRAPKLDGNSDQTIEGRKELADL